MLVPTPRTTLCPTLFTVLVLLPALAHLALAANYCGTSYSNARKCATACPRGLNGECPGRERCYAGVTCPTQPTSTVGNRCGTSYSNARKCATACPRGFNSECPGRERCYARVRCGSGSSSSGGGSSTPSARFARAVVSAASNEYARYGRQHECNSRSLRARIGTYWRAIGLSLDGCNRDVPWSAAFISYVVRAAGAGSRFRYSSAHRVYIEDAFRGGRGLYGSVRSAGSSTVRTGDLVCSGRGRVRAWTYRDFYSWFRRGGSRADSIPTHCDVVTGVSGSRITTVGGNVNQQVTRKTVSKSTYAIVLVVNRNV